MTLNIRPAQKGDGAIILSLIRELADFEKLTHEMDATEDLLDAALFGPQPAVFCDLAEWDGEPVGFGLWFVNFSSFRGRHGVYLEDLFVRPSHRGRGIGRAMLRRLARLCVTRGWTRFEWSVLNWNESAITFYKASGAQFMNDWTICRVSDEALRSLANE